MKKLFSIFVILLAVMCCVSLTADAKTRTKKRANASRVSATPGVVNEITPQQFKQMVADWQNSPKKFNGRRPAVVDIYAPWCGPCKRLAPILERLAKRYHGQVDFYRIDGDNYREFSKVYLMRGYPTVLVWAPRKGIVNKSDGQHEEDFYVQQINNALYD